MSTMTLNQFCDYVILASLKFKEHVNEEEREALREARDQRMLKGDWIEEFADFMNHRFCPDEPEQV